MPKVSTKKTVGELVDKIATVSSTSGQPSVIRFKDASEAKSRDVMLTELNRIEKSPGRANRSQIAITNLIRSTIIGHQF